MFPRILMGLFAAATLAASRAAAGGELIWQLGARDGSRNEFLATGYFEPAKLLWVPLHPPEASADRTTFTVKLDRLGEFPKPRFPIGLRSAALIQTAISNGAAKAIVEWDDPTGGPEELELWFAYADPNARGLRIVLPHGRVRYLDHAFADDVWTDGPLHWKLPFNADAGANRIVFELIGERSEGYDFDMLAVHRADTPALEEPPTPIVQLDPVGDELAGIYAPGGPIRVKMHAENLPPETEREFSWEMKDFFGKVVGSGALATRSTAGGEAAGEIECRTEEKGFFTVHVTLVEGAEAAREKPKAILPVAVFAPYEDAGAAKEAHFGTDLLHPGALEDTEFLSRCVRLERMIGSRWARFMPFALGRIEPEEGKWDWELTDRNLEAFVEGGQDIVGGMWIGAYSWAPPAQWAMDPAKRESNGARWIPRMDVWERFMEALVDRYKDRIHAWEMLNEPYANLLGDGEAYGEMMKIAARVIRERAPGAKIVCGCLMGRTGPGERKFEDDWFRVAGPDSFDVVGVHYASRKRWAEYEASMRAWGVHKPVWDTEGHVSGFGDPYSEAEELVRYYVVKLALGVERMSYHSWLWLMTWPTRPFAVSPIMAAHRTLAHHLNFARYLAPVSAARDVECHAFACAEGDGLLVLWNRTCANTQERDAAGNVSGGGSGTVRPFARRVTLAVGQDAVRRVDIMDNETTLAPLDGLVDLDVTATPIFLRGISIEAVRRLAAIEIEPLHAARKPGQWIECAAVVRNLSKEALEGKLRIELPTGWAGAPAEAAVSVPAGGEARMPWRMRPGTEAALGATTIPVTLSAPGSALDGATGRVAVSVAKAGALENLVGADARDLAAPEVGVIGGEFYYVGAAGSGKGPANLDATFLDKGGAEISTSRVDASREGEAFSSVGGIIAAPADATTLVARLTGAEPLAVTQWRVQLIEDVGLNPNRLQYWAQCARRGAGESGGDTILLDRIEQVRRPNESGALWDPKPYGWGGPADLSASATTSYDSKRFHVRAAVRDDSVQCVSALLEPRMLYWWYFPTDAIQVVLEPPAGKEGQFHYIFTVAGSRVWRSVVEPDGALHREAIPEGWVSASGTPTLITGEEVTDRVTLTLVEKQDGVVYDLAIPWALMDDFEPKAGDRAGFFVRVHDCDLVNGTPLRRGWIEWPDRQYPDLYDPSGFGTLEFAD
ncbi:MAG: NEW3 domain-containing protein [Planctomycetota bacterium]